MKNKKIKKYNYGTSIRNYMENPYTALQQDKINNSKAAYEAQSNPYLNTLQGLGNLATQYGLNMKNPDGSTGFGSSNVGQLGNTLAGLFANTDFAFAYGGQVPVEIEGGEIGELPNGNIFQAKGNSHEQGGIKTTLPEMTEMFSKRIKIDNVSMANRKKKREKKEITLKELLEKNQSDTILKNTIKRTTEVNQNEENFDKNIQNLVSSTMSKPEQKYAYGNTITDPEPPTDPILYKQWLAEQLNLKGKAYMESGLPSMYSKNYNPVFDSPSLSKNVTPLPTIPIAPVSNIPQNLNRGEAPLPTLSSNVNVGDSFENRLANSINFNTSKKSNFWDKLRNFKMEGLPAGDSIGLLGDVISTFSPYLNTMKNRSQDIPNINPFLLYGERGLQTLDDTKEYVNQVRDEKLKDLELSRNSAIRRGRNSARGVNTMRALDIGNDMNFNNSASDVRNQFAQQMMNILSQQAQMQNNQDQVVMQGEAVRDLSDRQDNDNFYTQKGRDMANIGYGLQNIGGRFNKFKGRTENLGMIEEMKRLGLNNAQIQAFLEMFGELSPKTAINKK